LYWVLGVVALTVCSQAPNGPKSHTAVLVDETKRQLQALFNRCETTRREMTQPGAMSTATDETISAMDRCSKLLPNTTIQGVKLW